MIKKQSIFYGLIFLILASMGGQAHAMKWTKHQWAGGFRLGMKSLNYAAIIGLPAYLSYKNKIHKPAPLSDPNAQAVSPEVEKFVISTLLERYPELKDRPVKVLTSPKATFAAQTQFEASCITVPNDFDDAELNKAREFKEKNHYIMSYEKCLAKAKEKNLSVYEFLSISIQAGHAVSPYTLDAWKGLIFHEGSHLLHYDTTTHALTNISSPIATLYGAEKLKQILKLNAAFAKQPILGNILKGLGYIPSLPLKLIALGCLNMVPQYWSEYRADQDAIKRIQDPDILKAMSIWLENMPAQDTSDVPAKIKLLADPHPLHKTRAKYFAEAAQKLEEKQAQEKIKNGVSHD